MDIELFDDKSIIFKKVAKEKAYFNHNTRKMTSSEKTLETWKKAKNKFSQILSLSRRGNYTILTV